MAAAMSLLQSGHQPTVLERYPATEPRGNILNLWPPPIEALDLLGVDIDDIGAPCQTIFRNHKGRTRATIHISDELQKKYGGDFIGLLRPDLYKRMYDSLPTGIVEPNLAVESFTQNRDGVRVQLSDGSTREFDVLIGADGINSVVRRTLWGEEPIREHNLHIFGGYTMKEFPAAKRGEVVISWSRDKQGSYTSIRSNGKDGFEWWVIEAHPANTDFTEDYHATATRIAAEFPFPLPELVAATDPTHMHRWVLRDRIPLKKWSKGRATIIGDASHPTSPYAGYGAGMAIEDGYFLGRALAGVDLTNLAEVEAALAKFEAPRIAHTANLAERAYKLSQVMHHAPKIARPFRDLMMDHTPFLQKVAADGTPGEIMKQVDIIVETEKEFQAKMRTIASDGRTS
ncbi:MAG: FAD-dependent monooxygenase [Candidatus Leucobacter sulfamidivorax]|nr:FAD-dependent monooxygenase [Candidatus Leucobacter sulfamidivorax]